MAKLIGTKTEVTNKEMFRLNMFDFDIDEDNPGVTEEASGSGAIKEEDTTVNISLNSSKTRQDLEKIISEMTMSL